MSEVVATSDALARPRAVEVLRDGELVVFPTDTVYGVAADAFKPAATAKLFTAKRRSRFVPLPVLVRSSRQLSGLVEGVPEPAERLIATYWPGPLTIILRAISGLTWDLGESRGTVAVRMPADEFTVELVGEVGPLACTGANVMGLPLTKTYQDAREQLGDSVALYIDGGECTGLQSTVVDVTRGEAQVVRSGAINAAHIRMVATGEVAWGQRPTVEEGQRPMVEEGQRPMVEEGQRPTVEEGQRPMDDHPTEDEGEVGADRDRQ